MKLFSGTFTLLFAFSSAVGLTFRLAADSIKISPTEIAPLRKNIDKLHSYLDDGVTSSSWEYINDEFRELDGKIVALKGNMPFSWMKEIGELRIKADESVPAAIRNSAENDVPELFKVACVAAPNAFKPEGGKNVIHDVEENVVRDIDSGSDMANIERRLQHALVGYALLGHSSEGELKNMGKRLWDFCIQKHMGRDQLSCRVAQLAIKDPGRVAQQFEKVRDWEQKNDYARNFSAETIVHQSAESASARGAALRRRSALQKSCETSMIALADQTKPAGPKVGAFDMTSGVRR